VPFTDRFQLLDLKRDEGARTYEAREIATGRPVFVHLFPNCTAPLNRALLAKIDTLPEEERYRIIDRGPHERGVYVVTDRLAEYPGLREWVQAKNEGRQKPLDAGGAWQIKAPAQTVPPNLPVPDPPPSPFDTAPLPAIEPSPTSEPLPAILTNSGEQTLQLPSSAEAPAPAPKEPGEFTRQFAPPALRPAAPTPAPKEAPPSVPPPSANQPGEFTRQFAPPVLRPTPPAPAPKEAPVAPPSANQPGEFTRQFSPPARPAEQPPAAQAPGEFTQLFAASPLKPAVPQKAAPPPGEFTRQFQAPQRPVPAPSTRVAPPSQNTPPQTSPQPGEFTQMLQAQRPAAPAPPTNQPSQSGEFTRYFQSPMTPSQGVPGHIAPSAPLRPSSHPKDAGEFTQIFGRGDIPSAPPPPTPAAPPNPASANATQVFAAPRPNSPMPMASPNVPPQGVQQGPGEYTQMFAKAASLTFGQARPAPQAIRTPEAAPTKRNSSRLPLLLVMGAVVLLIIAVIVYFVMRQHST